MDRRVVGVVAVMLIGAAGCGGGGSSGGVGGHDGGTSDAHGTGGATGGAHGSGGVTGTGGAGTGGMTDAGADLPAAGGMTGSGGMTGTGGSGGGGVTGSGGSILDAGAVPASCPSTINGVLAATDSVQTGRESRIPNAGVCGAPKGYPGNGADPSNPHLYNAYHFANPSGAAVCFNFTLTYDSGATDASAGVTRYLTAYSTYDPLNIGNTYLGDVGAVLTSPQTMGITVPANSSIDVVVFAIDVAPNGTGSYTLSCTTGSGDAGTGGNDGGATDGGTGGAGGEDGGGADGSDGSVQDAAPDA